MMQLNRTRSFATPALLAFTAISACNLDRSNSDESTEVATETSPLYVDTGSLWDSTQVPVCWENDDLSSASGRQWVREQIEKTWEFVANVDFTGWGHCESSWWLHSGVTIEVSDETPHSNWLGQSLWGSGIEVDRALLTLNFTYANWSTSCASKKESCTRSIATHEFGHLLGFAHEQNRDDSPESCTAEKQGSDGDEVYGSWDLNSVMNYCNPVWNNGGELSSTDIEGAQAYYGVGRRYVAALIATVAPV